MATRAGAGSQPATPGLADPRRLPSALVDAVTGMQLDAERASVRLGALVVLVVFVMLGRLATDVQALAWLGRLPWWLSPAFITAGAAVVVSIMPLLLLPSPVLDAWTVLTRLSMIGQEAWKKRFGSPFPSPAEADAWLAAHPDDDDAVARAQVLVLNGRALEASVPDEANLSGAIPRFARAQTAWLCALMTGDDTARAVHRRRVAELSIEQEPEDLPIAKAVNLMIEAFEVNLRDGEWIAPLIDARRELGPAADGTVLRWMVLPRLRYYGRISLLIFIAVAVVQIVLGGLLTGGRLG